MQLCETNDKLTAMANQLWAVLEPVFTPSGFSCMDCSMNFPTQKRLDTEKPTTFWFTSEAYDRVMSGRFAIASFAKINAFQQINNKKFYVIALAWKSPSRTTNIFGASKRPGPVGNESFYFYFWGPLLLYSLFRSMSFREAFLSIQFYLFV